MPRTLIIIGIMLLTVGLVMHFAPGLLKWFGHLPGDIRIEQGNTRIFIPVTSMILISLVLTLIANFWR